MRIGVYVFLSVCISLLVADGFYIQRTYTTDDQTVQPLTQTNDLQQLLQQIAERQRQANYDEVLLLVRDALETHPGVWQLHMARAQSLMQLGRAEAALKDLDIVLTQKPTLLAARADRARAYRHLNRIDEAFADVTDILSVDPQNEDALFLLGSIYYEQGQYKAAVEQFTACLEAHPQSVLSLFNRAQAYAELGNFEQARADMQQFIQNVDDEQLQQTGREVMQAWQ